MPDGAARPPILFPDPSSWAADRSHVDPALGDVALICMPFGSVLQPSMALGQIQSQLIEAGLNAFSVYLNVEFAQAFGLTAYELVAKRRGVDVQLGEWMFAHQVWDEPTAMDEEAFLKVAERELSALTEDGITLSPADATDRILTMRRDFVPVWLDRCADTLCANPTLKSVGFSCLFFQTLPSLALARRIHARRPDIKIVFGGPSMHGEMGPEYMRAAPWIDAMAVGEADKCVAPMFKALARGEALDGLGDVLWRATPGGEIHVGGPSDPADAATLNALPLPDYENYFRAMARAGFLADATVHDRIFVPYETSRGCWWGQKKHCTFCGLNPLGMNYRAKSPDRAIEIVEQTVARWGVPRLLAVDNILPQNYYSDVLPKLRDGPYANQLQIWYEIKTNVAREKVRLLAEAGITLIVPGIESLSTNILRAIDKGVTAIHNVYALKLFAEYGVLPGWGMLIRIPGERGEDYAQMSELCEKLTHLHPPFSGPRLVELHRFSPYHFRSDEFVDDFWPQDWYRGLFPEGAVDLRKVAYYFDADWRDVATDADRAPLVDSVWRWIEAWRDRPVAPRLTMRQTDQGGIEIGDTRGDLRRLWKLDATEATVLRLLDDPLPRNNLADSAAAAGVGPERAEAIVADFLAHNLAVELDGKLLGLPIPQGAPEADRAYRRTVFSRVGQKAMLDEARAARDASASTRETALTPG